MIGWTRKYWIVCAFSCDGSLDHALIDVDSSSDYGVFPYMQIIGYATNFKGVSFPFMVTYSLS